MRNAPCFDPQGHCRSATALVRQLGAAEHAFRRNCSPAHEDKAVDGRRRWRVLHLRQPSVGSSGCNDSNGPQSHWTDSLVAAEAAVFAAVDACRKDPSTLEGRAAVERAESLDGWILDVIELLQARLSDSTIEAIYHAIAATNECLPQCGESGSAKKS